MTDSGGPQRRTLCFLSTLLSQKVPEKSDTVLRCMISGQPKPEVTWYKNGHTVEEGNIVSSYEFFENQYIHVLHLYCCTQNDAAVYQISAKNCFGMICCSASIEVECSSENTQLLSNPKDDGDTGGKCETQTYEQKSTSQIDEKEPSKEGESLSLGTPMSAEPSSSKFNHLCSLQLLTSHDINTSSSENPVDVKGTRQTGEAWDPNNTERTADGLLSPNSGHIPNKQDVYHHGTAQSKLSKLTDGALNSDEDLSSGHQSPKAQKCISVSLPLSEAATSIRPGDRATVNDQISPQASSTDSDSDYELCPEITLTYTEEFSDDDLEYLECSDVMTDYSNAVWQRNLEGTECVFLLESDDEDMEFGKYCLGECEAFLSEMGRGPRVSDNRGRMEASPDHSQSQGARGARRCRASTHSPPSPQAGMTPTLGSHEDGTSVVTEQGTYKRPTASADNDYPGIQGETRESHQAGEESARDSLLAMDEAAPGREGQCLSAELEKAGVNQCLEIVAEKGPGEKDFRSKRGSEKPARGGRPGIKGKAKKLSPNLKDSAAEGTPNHLSPQEPAKPPLTQTDKKDAQAEAPDLNSQLLTEGAALTRAEQETERLQRPPGTLPQEGSWSLVGEGVQVNNLLETKWVPDQTDHPQVQTQETLRERLCPSQMPPFSEPAGEGSAFTRTTSQSLPDLGGIDEEHASLAQYLETEGCTQGPQHKENKDREDNTPRHSWEGPGHEPNLPEVNHATVSPWELSVCLPQEGCNDPGEPQALSVVPPVPEDMVSTREAACHGPGGREAECLTELLEAGDQGTGDTMNSPAGSPVHKYLPQGVCSMDLELAEGQGKVSDLCFPDDRTLDVVLQTRGSEPPPSTGKSNKGRNSVVSPAPSNTLTWNMSQKASEGSPGEHLAKMQDSASTLASTAQERPIPCVSGGLEERHPLSAENSFVWCKEGAESPSTSALDTTGSPASHSSVVRSPQETPTTSTAHPECLQVTRESEDTPTGTIATEVHPAKSLPVSVAENSHADGPDESSSQVPDGNIFLLPPSVQSGPLLNGSTSESPEELCPAPRGPEVHVCVPPVPEGGFCSSSPLQIDTQSAEKSQAVGRADKRSLEEDAQGKGSEATQRMQQESRPCQGSLPEDSPQESWPTTSAAQGETTPVPWDHSSANSGGERRQSSGLEAKTPEDDDSHAVGSVPPPSQVLLGPSKESGPGHWGAGDEPETIARAASVSEVWPPRQPTGSESEGSEAGAMPPDGLWAVAAGPDRAHSEPAAPAGGAQAEAQSGSGLADDRDSHEGKKPARRAHWSCLSSRYLRQPRFLGSSVDPIDDGVTDQPSEAPNTGGQGGVNNASQTQEEKQRSVAHLAFFKQLLSHPDVLESSVDPEEAVVGESARVGAREPPESALGAFREEAKLNDGNLGQSVEVRPATPPGPGPQPSRETIPSEHSTSRHQEARERGRAEQCGHDEAQGEVQLAALRVLRPDEGGATVPRGCSGSQAQEGREWGSGGAELREEDGAGAVFPTSPLSSGLAVLTRTSVGVDTDSATGQIHDVPENHTVEPRNHQHAFSDSKERGEAEGGNQPLSPRGLTQLPCASSPEGNTTGFSISHKIEEPEMGVPQSGETKPASASSSPAVTSAFVSGECASETAPETLRDPCHRVPALGHRRESGEERPSSMAAQTGRSPVPAWEEVKKKQEIARSGHLTEGVKKKILSKVAALRLRLEQREKARKNSSFPTKIPKLETSVSGTDEKKDPTKPPCKREGKAPVLLKKIQAEMFPDHSGNVRLTCQFAEIHEDSTIWWTKDSKSIAQVQRSAGDTSIVSLVIVQASQKDQGLYYCCLKNSYGKVTAEFDLTAEVLKQLSSPQDRKGYEEIEFSQLIFKEDFLHDSYFGDRLRGQIATEELHFGEGVHRKAFRSKVMQGLMPVFQPGHACVLKVHNAVAYGTRNNDELIQRNYDLAAQECYVQNTARCYAKIYAAEAQPLEGFGEVPEIIPIFLIHRPNNNIPYATVEEELIGEFVKYSIRDGKEINFLRRDSEAGQKCCTFQHWVYQKTGGCLLVTDMQGVGMKLTDVGIATLAKGYKGFKGNCSMTFIDQFKALHQCNKYCKMLGLEPLQSNQKQKRPRAAKSKSQPNSATAKKTGCGTPAQKKT
ncbi:alpha-protein kinase 2 [Molossus molossus]|uniref:Alpha-protein kinase 2 n=1 Tax=Molossus molossus TaxID=27622 RepID=A0A7J8HFL5_MOLMO|nr:alpha-protein kinase 2 [Molossus molossus]KAF6470699.1 alpha kinase 2 [Molossus molossus]